MKIGILQPGYFPWLGYFDLMRSVDHFVILDDVQFTKQDWRTRNRIRTPSGWIWLSVPIRRVGSKARIDEVPVNHSMDWERKHWTSIKTHYGQTRFFSDVAERLLPIYESRYAMLVDLDIDLAAVLAQGLDIQLPRITRASQLDRLTSDDPTDNLIEICRLLGGTTYISGPAAKVYLNLDAFAARGIDVVWQQYTPPDYSQRFAKRSGMFISHLTAADLLFNQGFGSGSASARIFAGQLSVALGPGIRRVTPDEAPRG